MLAPRLNRSFGDGGGREFPFLCQVHSWDKATREDSIHADDPAIPRDHNMNATSPQRSRGDWTPLELFLAGVRGWNAGFWERFENGSSVHQ